MEEIKTYFYVDSKDPVEEKLDAPGRKRSMAG